MIIQCKSCSRKFVVDDKDIPEKGRTVQCGYCSVTWHQMPIRTSVTTIRQTKIDKPIEVPPTKTFCKIFQVSRKSNCSLFMIAKFYVVGE